MSIVGFSLLEIAAKLDNMQTYFDEKLIESCEIAFICACFGATVMFGWGFEANKKAAFLTWCLFCVMGIVLYALILYKVIL